MQRRLFGWAIAPLIVVIGASTLSVGAVDEPPATVLVPATTSTSTTSTSTTSIPTSISSPLAPTTVSPATVSSVTVSSVTPSVPSVPAVTAAPTTVRSGQRCPQFEDTARAVGWPEDAIDRLSYIMWRESRCEPTAHNPRPPDDSYCLIQLNMRAHKSWVGPIVDWDFNRLFDPTVCLTVGLELWHKAGGWGPWRV